MKPKKKGKLHKLINNASPHDLLHEIFLLLLLVYNVLEIIVHYYKTTMTGAAVNFAPSQLNFINFKHIFNS